MSVPVLNRTEDKVPAGQRKADERAVKARDRFHCGLGRWIVLAVIGVGALVMPVPFAMMLLNAFKSPADYSTTARSAGRPSSTPRA
jgi:raffinose/stachyose/melibiose transport system permease protein